MPGQRPDSPLGSVLGRPSPETPLARHFTEVLRHRPVLPAVDAAVDLFRRQDADRTWLAKLLAQAPSRLLYVGHASSAEDKPIGPRCTSRIRPKPRATPTRSVITAR